MAGFSRTNNRSLSIFCLFTSLMSLVTLSHHLFLSLPNGRFPSGFPMLYVLEGVPEEVFTELFKKWNVKRLTFEVDIEPYPQKRDEAVTKLAKKHGVEVITSTSHTIYNPEAVIAKNLGKTPLTMQKWISVAEGMPAPPRPVEAPVSVPAAARAPLDEGKYLLPTLEKLGVDHSTMGPCLYPGGETEALRRMEEHLKKTEYICKFEKPNTSPNSLKPSTTVLSPYFRFGCLSSRLFYYKLKEVITGRPHSKPPVSLMGQMYWREFYYTVAAGTPNFDQMVDNPVCAQVPWDNNPEYLEAWAHGRTGYPFIDAIMRQLRQEGWIHHLARHAVACFLTRGDLWQSWEEGQKVFEELLLDQDWSLNAGNWMWLSASAFFHQFHRVYSPVVFGKKTDKLGDYIRKYVPEVKKFPPEYIYEPWEAPMSVQKTAGCVIGTDYPRRIVKHEEVYKKNIARMSAAYKSTKEMKASPDKNQKRPSDGGESSTKKKPKSKSIKDYVKK
ncbi:cryptochrome-2-like [Macrosteles quadrilineatus]|uniref:cryptochrome-2-like n=1 Tax=Macrosteles quadrilineatus TaxID=74068 RepID=UPI0023E1A65C|nr:cryptochrome-2-like [Macrosteles quadrilineatus]